jgi:hypothetical protein
VQNSESEVSVEGLPVPSRLIKLIQFGFWPQTDAEERKQNIKSLVSKERIELFAPGLCLRVNHS